MADTPGYRQLNPVEVENVALIKKAESAFLEVLGHGRTTSRPNRETALAITKVQEAAMWAVRGVTG